MNKTKAILAWLFFLLFSCEFAAAQQYDKVWAMGQPVTTMTFNADSVILENLQDSLTTSFETVGSICDVNGNFLFYSNGITVFNKLGNIMPNGDSLSYPSEYYDQVDVSGMPSLEGVVILPKPNNANQYCIVHYSPVDTFMSAGGYESLNLYYSIVDITLDSGRGDLIAKNHPLIQDELLSYSRLAACKHANGRDWWIVKNAWSENIYYTFLLTPDSIEGPFIQHIGPSYGTDNEQWGYSAFSLDGSKYATVAAGGPVVLMDFDRCTGLFTNPDSFYNNGSSDPVSNPFPGGNSIAFSPSGRFLYIDNPVELNQYDLWSPQIHDSIRIETDTNEFYEMNLMQLAPNGKIYLSCYNGGSYKIHTINQPDSLGLGCDFQLFSQSVLSVNSWNLPYFPNYRLGALIGSGCDTLTEIQTIAAAHPAFATVTPNPASDWAVLVYYAGSSTANQAVMYDVTGREVWSANVTGSAGSIAMNLSSFPAGIYIVKFTADGNTLMNTKLVIDR